MSRPLPPISSETREWWDATRDRQLMVQRCGSCGHDQLYPRAICVACHGQALSLVQADGSGRIYSFSVVHRSPDEQHFSPPYIVALIRLSEGPTITSNVVGARIEAVSCDLPVTVTWEPLEDGRHLPLFTPSGA